MKNFVTIGVASLDEVKARVAAAFRGEPQGSYISFPTIEQMWRTLSPKRADIVRAMTGAGPISIREVARRVGRDIKAVHGDVTALIAAGVIDRRERLVEFPYDAVHVDFMWGKAA